MTKHNFTALDLFIIQDTIYQSLRISNYSGRGTIEGRQQILEKICDIMMDMNVELTVEKPNEIEELKGKTLYNKLEEWYEFGNHCQSKDVIVNELINIVKDWLPQEHDTNSYKWNECIRMIRGKLR